MYPGSKKTTYIGSGDQTLAYSMDFTSTSANGFFLAAVETHSATGAGVVAAVGDSIVAGGGSTGQNTKWSDRLAVRLQGVAEPPRHLMPIHLRHADIEQHNIRPEVSDFFEGLFAVFRLAADCNLAHAHFA